MRCLDGISEWVLQTVSRNSSQVEDHFIKQTEEKYSNHMRTKMKVSHFITGLSLVLLVLVLPLSMQAQKLKHKDGGGKSSPAVSRAAGNNRSINGGNQSSAARNRGGDSKTSIGNKTNVSAGNKTNVGSNNKVNIDNSKKNVNVNVDNSKNIKVNNNRNTVVRHNSRPYGRPPTVSGGHRYYSYHPYHYHPYHPFFWGPVWHPWGFFITTLAVTAIIVSVESQQYHYDSGVYYVASNGGYTVVQAPVGATITTLPPNSQTVVVNETTNNYYYGGTYYEKGSKGYTVVAPTAGTLVENLPEGGVETKIGDITYVKVGETFYQPIDKDGKNMYEVVEVTEDK